MEPNLTRNVGKSGGEHLDQVLKDLAEKRQNDVKQMLQLVQAKNLEYQQLGARLKKREERLNRYADSLNQWRSQTKELCVFLVKEIQTARAMHPLKDYLALTELELSKIEVQLLKTPTLSKERSELETCATQLLQQRDFLKKTIENSMNQLEKRAQLLSRIIQSSKVAPVPPSPPMLD